MGLGIRNPGSCKYVREEIFRKRQVLLQRTHDEAEYGPSWETTSVVVYWGWSKDCKNNYHRSVLERY